MKHSQHLKNKKKYTKPLKKKEQLQASQNAKLQSSNVKGGKKKVFGKPVGTSSHKKKRTAQKVPAPVIETEMDDDTVQDILDNVASDDEDPETPRQNVNKKRKRLATDHDAEDEAKNAKHFEKEYAQMTFAEESTKKRVVSLLPIKTKAGEVVTRTAEMEYEDDEEENQSDEMEDEEEEIEEEIDSDDDIIKDNAVVSWMQNSL